MIGIKKNNYIDFTVFIHGPILQKTTMYGTMNAS